jgi:hypothetical protein
MAIKRDRSNPVILLDCVIGSVSRDVYTDRETGVVSDRGRKLSVQTAQGPELEVKVPADFDVIEFPVGVNVLLNAEYSEWRLDSGKEGSSMKFAGFVGADQLDRWRGVVQAQAKAAASA